MAGRGQFFNGRKLLSTLCALALVFAAADSFAGNKPGKGQLQDRIEALEEALGNISAPPSVFNVDCDAGDSINDAIDQAGSGATINVSGSCNENVVLTKDALRLIGAPGASITAASGTVVATIGRNTRIVGLTITGGSDGIVASRGGSTRILDSNISGASDDCIVVTRGSYAEIKGNTVTNCGNDGLNIRNSSGSDVHLNTISGHGDDGIQLSNSSSMDLDGNVISDNGRRGVAVFRASSVSLSGDPTVPFAQRSNTIIVNGDRGVFCFQGGGLRLNQSQTITGNSINFPGRVGANREGLVSLSCTVSSSGAVFP